MSGAFSPSIPPIPPVQFQKAMIFIDGTNLFHRLDGVKLQLKEKLSNIVESFVENRQVVRVYMYTSKPYLQHAKEKHGDLISDGLRVVQGDAVPKKDKDGNYDGNYKEKGVDALLVADLVYHAAVKNYDYALLVSTDTDFVQALKRVEDFGCRTGVLGLCCDIPDRLKEACDDTAILSKSDILTKGWAIEI
ncbi:MAG: NYN domain-containing protein [Nostocaceae cyanobacterium]|nr:NYN domain-containing protein [Nostocaceae cyanobacterium]